MSARDDHPAGSQTAGRVVVMVFVLIAVLVVGYFALGMPGMDMSKPMAGENRMNPMPGMQRTTPRITNLGVNRFALEIARPGSFVVNVHVPYAGEIGGTDAFIPFNRMVGDARLPQDKRARLLVYCRTGRMSALAAAALSDRGFTDVAVLRGGMEAWEASGRNLDVVPGR